ncbi:MAG: OsmC family protein [Acholeplasmataceae bacterium]|nr:OsmC family protein [Acholeplasmataceae bacterium]
MMDTHLYEVRVVNESGQKGYTTSSSGFEVLISSPRSNEPGSNAGELLSMSYATCLNAAIITVLNAHRLNNKSRVTVIYRLMGEPEKKKGYYFLLICEVAIQNLNVSLVKKYLEMAESLCPVSKIMHQYPHLHTTVVEYEKEATF